MKPRLYLTQVMHQRLFPVRYRFRYPVFSLLLDIDSLEQTCAQTRLLTLDGFGLLSFHRRDHGARDGSALRPWLETHLNARGIDLAGGRIFLLCFPRLLGYGFDPISLWFCQHADGSLRAVLAEVRNTFGQHHGYLLHDQGRPMPWPAKGQAEKCFYVSPLMPMRADYQFHFSEPTERLGVSIRQFQDGELALVATQSGQGRPITDRHLLRALLRTPLMTFKVMFAIHWQALKIRLRGVAFHHKPAPPAQEVS